LVTRRRTDERGAALFVIVLVVSLLTAIGVFAMHATSLAQLGSGYSRRAATALYLAEFAANQWTATLADDAGKYVGIGNGNSVDRSLPWAQQNNCYAAKDLLPLYTAPDLPYCIPYSTSLATNDAKRSNPSLGADPEGFFGALNRPDAPPEQVVNGSIRVESTDHFESPIGLPGFDITGGTKIWQDTLTISGVLQPPGTVSDMCTAAVTRASETDRLRALVTYAQIQQ
jgi:hypothetical protein